jgi:hypothetical protein
LGHQCNQRPGNLLLVFSFGPTLSRASHLERFYRVENAVDTEVGTSLIIDAWNNHFGS